MPVRMRSPAAIGGLGNTSSAEFGSPFQRMMTPPPSATIPRKSPNFAAIVTIRSMRPLFSSLPIGPADGHLAQLECRKTEADRKRDLAVWTFAKGQAVLRIEGNCDRVSCSRSALRQG